MMHILLVVLGLFCVVESVAKEAGDPPVNASGVPPAIASASPDYRIGPEDVLEISVWREETLQKQALVRPDGGMSFPLVGNIQAAGRTAEAGRLVGDLLGMERKSDLHNEFRDMGLAPWNAAKAAAEIEAFEKARGANAETRAIDGALNSLDGQVFVFFVMVVAAAEVAVGLAIIINVFRARETVYVDEVNLLKG